MFSDGDLRPGQFIRDCKIDLPPNDVVEQVEFERFLVLNLSFGAVVNPVVLNMRNRVLNRVRSDLGLPSEDHDRRPLASPEDHDEGAQPQAATGGESRVISEEELAALARSGTLRSAEAATTGGSSDTIDIDGLRLAFYLPYTQSWKLKGYTSGRIINSIALSPGEEQTIEVFTWDRLRSTLESETTFESEQATEGSTSRRDTTDVAREVTRQAGFEATTSGKVGFQVGVVNADLSVTAAARAGLNDRENYAELDCRGHHAVHQPCENEPYPEDH